MYIEFGPKFAGALISKAGASGLNWDRNSAHPLTQQYFIPSKFIIY